CPSAVAGPPSPFADPPSRLLVVCIISITSTAALADTTTCARVRYEVDPSARNLLRLEGSAEVRLAAGDLLLVLHDGEAVGAGRISEVATGRPLGRLDWVERELPGRGWALVVARDLPIRVEPNLPPFIRRNARPGPVVSLNGRGGEQPDRKTAPQRLGVVAIEANGDHQILDLAPAGPAWGVRDRQMPTTARAGTPEMATMGIGDRCDMYRGTRYAGFAKVNSIGTGGDAGLAVPGAGAGRRSGCTPSAARHGSGAVRVCVPTGGRLRARLAR
ncbi:MAG: hypothetical protein ACYS7M_07575, partial [Planctomycetota bacterium]